MCRHCLDELSALRVIQGMPADIAGNDDGAGGIVAGVVGGRKAADIDLALATADDADILAIASECLGQAALQLGQPGFELVDIAA